MVGVDQAQIDKILSGASSEDPEARLDTLERELDFVKTSIKRLLIDLRERMNELDNPFTSAAASYSANRFEPPDVAGDAADEDSVPDDTADIVGPEIGAGEEVAGLVDGLFPADLGTAFPPAGGAIALAQEKPAGKLKLQMVHRLFAWVNQGCGKYGHERMIIMIDAYRSMGYINEDVSEQIREIMRMVPETRRDVAEIGPNEFVSELYVLNRILDPDDATLDRDMIEVMMLAHRRPGEQGVGAPSRERDAGDTWIELLDRI
ncbi:hypothetical protein [Methanoculleus sp.]|uniref:hypothetical protein n=1 Tax=Methanoculleus sp. TaxID=90427 RepID=UPI0025E035D1|nr:hypothetical protein [Methanoculleus sp.]